MIKSIKKTFQLKKTGKTYHKRGKGKGERGKGEKEEKG